MNLLLYIALLSLLCVNTSGFIHKNWRYAILTVDKNTGEKNKGIEKIRKLLKFPKINKEDSWEEGEIPWDFVDKNNTRKNTVNTGNTIYTDSIYFKLSMIPF